jgi:hypothetical protein
MYVCYGYRFCLHFYGFQIGLFSFDGVVFFLFHLIAYNIMRQHESSLYSNL